MTRRQIDASKEVRLWLTTVVMPAAAYVGVYLYLHPETKKKWKAAVISVKDFYNQKKEKKEHRKYQHMEQEDNE